MSSSLRKYCKRAPIVCVCMHPHVVPPLPGGISSVFDVRSGGEGADVGNWLVGVDLYTTKPGFIRVGGNSQRRGEISVIIVYGGSWTFRGYTGFLFMGVPCFSSYVQDFYFY